MNDERDNFVFTCERFRLFYIVTCGNTFKGVKFKGENLQRSHVCLFIVFMLLVIFFVFKTSESTLYY